MSSVCIVVSKVHISLWLPFSVDLPKYGCITLEYVHNSKAVTLSCYHSYL